MGIRMRRRSTTLLDLRLIAAHPDQLGGLSVLETSMLGQLPFSFCMGVGLAGAVANRVLNAGYPLLAFRYSPLILIAATLLVCIAPYLFFTRTLMSMRRSGMLRYGAFAHAVGEQFEKKWLHRSKSLNEELLDIPDFSTTTDLYGVVHNIDDIRIDRLGKWTYNAPSEHPVFAAMVLVVNVRQPFGTNQHLRRSNNLGSPVWSACRVS